MCRRLRLDFVGFKEWKAFCLTADNERKNQTLELELEREESSE